MAHKSTPACKGPSLTNHRVCSFLSKKYDRENSGFSLSVTSTGEILRPGNVQRYALSILMDVALCFGLQVLLMKVGSVYQAV